MMWQGKLLILDLWHSSSARLWWLLEVIVQTLKEIKAMSTVEIIKDKLKEKGVLQRV